MRCIGGAEFFARSAQKVRGSLSQKFMFVDGDRAVSGSYRFVHFNGCMYMYMKLCFLNASQSHWIVKIYIYTEHVSKNCMPCKLQVDLVVGKIVNVFNNHKQNSKQEMS